ncbi:MAG: LysM peptidoglycan-binding domain-containing protein, partial [Candidatus Eisenbacteria bacterium]
DPIKPAGASCLPDIEPEMNQKVSKWVEFYVTDGRKVFLSWMRRSKQYMDMVRSILVSEGLPSDLAYLVLIESGFNLHARSVAHAVGPWQFILGTARIFGLRVDPWVDERCDPERSTVAAARYLKHLYSMFESWPLAIAAYNGGEGRVSRALKLQNETDFWALRLPRQTEEYVPQFMAMLHVARDPGKYGLEADFPAGMPFEEVVVHGPLDLGRVAQLCNIPPDSVKLLNPAFKRQKTPARKGGSRVRLPEGKARAYVAMLAKEGIRADYLSGPSGAGAGDFGPPERPDNYAQAPPAGAADDECSPVQGDLYLTYTVRRGDNLHTIARNFDVRVNEIREFNDIGARNIIKPGQKLFIPRDAVKLAGTPSPKQVRTSAKIVHVVKSGDTLYHIARSYGVTVKDLVRWNSLGSSTLIRKGQRLTILPDQQAAPATPEEQGSGE